MSDVKQDQQQDAGKIRKKYENDLAQLTQVLGGQFLFKPSKLIPEDVIAAIKELAKEEKEKLVKDFKEKAVLAIQKQRDHIRAVAQLKKEFAKKEEDTMKEFSKTVTDLFKMLDNIKGIEKSYFDTLMGFTPSKEEEAATDEQTS